MRAVRIPAGPLTADFQGLSLDTLPIPEPQNDHVLVKVAVWGLPTEIDEIEGRAPPACLPMIPGRRQLEPWWPRVRIAAQPAGEKGWCGLDTLLLRAL
jgi:hypothetical protein